MSETSRSDCSRAARNTRATASPAGSTSRICLASVMLAVPRTRAYIGARRARACSSSSRMTMAAPSASTSPLRSLSKGLLASAGGPSHLERAPRARKASRFPGDSGVSVPPAITTVASPRRIFSAAHATESRPATHAVPIDQTCPCPLAWIAT